MSIPLLHSWPLFEERQRLDLGYLFAATDLPNLCYMGKSQMLTDMGVGHWHCRLADNVLTWSTGVYHIFGLPPGAQLDRGETVSIYAENSRAKMERLRAYAIKHRRGFTLDAEIIRPGGMTCRMRLIAAPVLDDGGRVVALHGVKQDLGMVKG